jgi:hypothetical protein
VRLPLTSWTMRKAVAACAITALLCGASQSASADQSAPIPAWLGAHVGTGPGQVALTVLKRARALYRQRVSEGVVRNPCYFAMDATKPNDPTGDKSGGRFYVVCEVNQSFKAIPAGHGSGRKLTGVVDFSNGRECVRNFGNAMDSNLTMGGSYMTSEVKTSFKGYYRAPGAQNAAYLRSFLQFDGEGETANARARAIGGHAAAKVAAMCMMKAPASPYANHDGLVPFGNLVTYAGGRSDGCTSWSPTDALQMISMVKDNPTTLYIYPESTDINAVAKAAAQHAPLSQAGLYWNDECLHAIGTPKFWTKATLEPVIAQYKLDNPPKPGHPLPICGPQ